MDEERNPSRPSALSLPSRPQLGGHPSTAYFSAVLCPLLLLILSLPLTACTWSNRSLSTRFTWTQEFYPLSEASPHSIVFRKEKKNNSLGLIHLLSTTQRPSSCFPAAHTWLKKQLGAPCCSTTPPSLDLTSTHSALQLHNWIPVLINTFPFPNSSRCPRTISASFSRKRPPCQIAIEYRTGKA